MARYSLVHVLASQGARIRLVQGCGQHNLLLFLDPESVLCGIPLELDSSIHRYFVAFKDLPLGFSPCSAGSATTKHSVVNSTLAISSWRLLVIQDVLPSLVSR